MHRIATYKGRNEEARSVNNASDAEEAIWKGTAAKRTKEARDAKNVEEAIYAKEARDTKDCGCA